MSEINYQALREAAERAIPAMERLLMLPADDDLLSEQELKDYGVDIDALNAFKFLTGPETVLALLDERERNQQYIKCRDQENEDIALTVGKLRVELEATENNLIDSECHVAELEEALRDKQALLEASEKRIAELEAREVVLPRAHDVHPLGPQSAKIFCEFHRSIVNRCSDEIRKVGVKVSIKGN
ncbi:ead/Ea22-like family protein [Salmonella enterica subsp. enterica serovar Heidelberg]|uniref:ead/Ea22-like family protein n=1 Tax=Salmonella enterica TaxID=28901 RepID=UPI00069A0B9B|nr:ead/Ea22-like family protein [Salmonella enterica]ECS2108380.1 ead/Ea22-like family protein [Salmonella enterica subsp. enterica serovar Heidelberg]ECS2976856.1 ead/Ea22-like family protein [Salmonella enterica subsp. enterica serovar Heidelberg]ECT2557330.1 ead/Ea22-like family protein [Salmonella enterica subsp. enterica serovar Heidelberg]ECU3365148.1 ead/Ea22-like family protein [Salmonella enterica subsp. enterica serovar Heidelberg]